MFVPSLQKGHDLVVAGREASGNSFEDINVTSKVEFVMIGYYLNLAPIIYCGLLSRHRRDKIQV